VLNPLYQAISDVVVWIHAGLAHLFGANSGASWALSIVLLTAAMRLILFPLFVKQIKTQRGMQLLQPKMKALQQKYKNDRQKLNEELMALYREHGVNPLTGCLPLLLQIPIFIALFHVLDAMRPLTSKHGALLHGACHGLKFPHVIGFPAKDVCSAAFAKVFGMPLAASFSSSSKVLTALHGGPTSAKVLSALLIVLMAASTFITQRQLMAKTAMEGPQATQQKVLLYILPVFFALFGFRFPLGVLLYWLTTNVWSMGQQFLVIRRMGPVAAAGAAGGGAGGSGGRPATPPRPAPAPAGPALAPSDRPTPSGAGPPASVGARRPAGGGRTRRQRRRGRR
jgi:YidC/Oxa1 family membrane protein insertase